jgi:hypothetical protein
VSAAWYAPHSWLMLDFSQLRWLGWLGVYAVLGGVACGSDGAPPAGGRAGAGQAGTGDIPGCAGGPASDGGSAGRGSSDTAGRDGGGEAGSESAGASSGEAGAGGASGGGSGGGGCGASAGGDGGAAGAPGPSLETLLNEGEFMSETAPRPAFGALLIAVDGERAYAVESRRDIETGPVNLPWRSRFRVAAYEHGRELWTFDAEPDDVISDVVVHPSGDVTVAHVRYPVTREAYALVRLGRDGAVRSTTVLREPATIPESDYGSALKPLFRMKSELADATVAGWVRLIAVGEDLAVAFLSYIDGPPEEPVSNQLVLGVGAFGWEEHAYVEEWARVVDGPHFAQPASWTYDELRWRDQAIRPFLARDATSGELVVGRAFNSTRCRSNLAVFAEFSAEDCLQRAVNPLENERLPLAVTRFDSSGARLGTALLSPDEDAVEQVPFALVARDGELAVAGSIVRALSDGTRRTYPDPSGFVDYDGYIAIYDTEGTRLRHHDFNQGRGDVLAALSWTAGGLVAAGSSGWDRWQGGMSISRGADPALVWLSNDAERSASRVLAVSDGSRHFNLHDLAVSNGAVFAAGFSDAPMTHSADGGNHAARTFGPLRLRLALP